MVNVRLRTASLSRHPVVNAVASHRSTEAMQRIRKDTHAERDRTSTPAGKRFLIIRSRNDHPDFPDAISIIGFTSVDDLQIVYRRQ